MSNEPIKRIVIHCTATPEGRHVTRDEIRGWHKAKGWKDIGYHWVLYLDGTIVKGRDESVIGAHVEGYNTGSIGVVYVGGLDKDGKPKDTRTPEQKLALGKVVKELRQRYPKAEILGHRDLSPDKDHDGVVEPSEWMKACPSFDVKSEIKGWLK
jgi:N-acetylmuramoyl-L-alanine amidase